jgi:hypothetical protein
MKMPEWVGERRFVVTRGGQVLWAFYVKERAERFASDRGLEVTDLRPWEG